MPDEVIPRTQGIQARLEVHQDGEPAMDGLTVGDDDENPAVGPDPASHTAQYGDGVVDVLEHMTRDYGVKQLVDLEFLEHRVNARHLRTVPLPNLVHQSSRALDL